MKKNMMAIVGMLMVFSSTGFAMTSDEIGNFYEKGIADCFYRWGRDKDSFFHFLTETMTPAALNWCNKAVTDVKSFVGSHSKNLVGMKDSFLNGIAVEFEKLHMQVINTIKVAKVVCLSSNPTREGLIQQYNIFEKTLKPKCLGLMEKLRKEPFTIEDKKDSKYLLEDALNTLRVLIDVAQASVKYKIDHI